MRAVTAGGVEDDVDVELAPRRVRGCSGSRERDGLLPIVEMSVGVLDGDGEAPVDRVVFEQIGEGSRVGDVVDGDDIEIVSIMQQPKHVPADSPEAHQTDSGSCHWSPLITREVRREPLESENRLGYLRKGERCSSLSQLQRFA